MKGYVELYVPIDLPSPEWGGMAFIRPLAPRARPKTQISPLTAGGTEVPGNRDGHFDPPSSISEF